MNEKRANLEIIAPTVEEAIKNGLAELGLSQERVEVEILDEGSRGLFGLGTRQARVRLTIKELPEAEARTEIPKPSEIATVLPPEEPSVAPKPPLTMEVAEDEYVLSVARETVCELLDRMKVQASVVAEYGKLEETRGRVHILINITGDDLSVLIGKRAETLNALQYITNLIVNKEVGRAVPLLVDVEGYRARRENQLRQLANRMADQAIKTGRRQVLEPMAANERRIIHITLRDNPQVVTESVGEEPRRKVTIVPKRE